MFDAWLRRASAVIGESTEALNALNVFPISDADTGSNLQLTLAGIARAVPDVNRSSIDAVVQAAILSAHGNSGAIVAEMFSSVCRSLQQPSVSMAVGGAGDRIALLLRTVADAARRAVAQPVAGTILTVAADAAVAAEQAALTSPDDALAVARAAQTEARLALQRTPDQLEVLAEAGVVDAGGQAYALLVDALVEVLGGEPAVPITAGAPASPVRSTGGDPEYEVMYALHGAEPEALMALKQKLSDLGHSVVVVGESGARGDRAGGMGPGVAQVHVHLGDPGAAVEAALGLGRLSQVRITVLEPVGPAIRSVIAVVPGRGLARAVAASGAVAVLTVDDQPLAELLGAALGDADGDVVVLPNDPVALAAARRLVAARRAERRPTRPHRRLAVIPTLTQVQGLAALAVHDPDADFDAVVTAMSAAAGHARHGAVTVAETESDTRTGRSFPGDVLGVVEGDVVEVGASVVEVAWRVVERLLAAGGELLTVVLGADATLELADELTSRTRERAAGVQVQVIDGGQPGSVVLVGLE